MPPDRLLAPDEPDPVEIVRPDGRSPVVLCCDHAGRRVPRQLGRLGLPEAAFDRHIAWDIGAFGVARRMAELLDAVLIAQRYSRLVVDCNRPPDSPNAVPLVSEATPIPGNVDLSPTARAARHDEVFRPYHDQIEAELDRRARGDRPTVLLAVHSFTPVYLGDARPWHVGTLYGRDARLAGALRPCLLGEPGLVVGDNEPYAVTDETDYTLPVHGERRGLVHLGIEIRQDLLSDAKGEAEWANRLARCLSAALRVVEGT